MTQLEDLIGQISAAERARSQAGQNVDRIQEETFTGMPARPQAVVATPLPYPEIKVPLSNMLVAALGPYAILLILNLICQSIFRDEYGPTVAYMLVAILFFLIAIGWAIAFAVVYRPRFKAAAVTRIQATPEYQAQCAAVDAENQRRVQEASAANAQAEDLYQQALQQFQAAYAQWKAERDQRLAAAAAELRARKAEVDRLAHKLGIDPERAGNPRFLQLIVYYVSQGHGQADAIRFANMQADKEARDLKRAQDRAHAQASRQRAAEQAQQDAQNAAAKEEEAQRAKKTRMAAIGGAALLGEYDRVRAQDVALQKESLQIQKEDLALRRQELKRSKR